MTPYLSWEYPRLDPLFILGGGVLLLILCALSLRSDLRRGFRFAPVSFLLRGLLVGWLCLYLLNPVKITEVSEPIPKRWLIVLDRTPSVWLREEVDAWQKTLYGELLKLLPPGSYEVVAYRGRGEERIYEPVPLDSPLPRGFGETFLLSDLEELGEQSHADEMIILHDGLELGELPALSRPLPLVLLLPERETFPREILLYNLELDAYALVRSPLRAWITLFRPPNSSRKEARVRIYSGEQIIGETIARFPPDQLTTTVTIDLLPTQEGIQGYRFEVVEEGSSLPWAQVDRRLVQVLRDRVRILYLIGAPTWNSRMFREIVKEDPLLDLVTFQILRTIGDQPMVIHEDELSLIPFPIRELFTTELPKFDIVIFDNFDHRPYTPWEFRETLLWNLRRYVEEGGGGFLLLIGDLMVQGGGLLYAGTPLGSILPVFGQGSFQSAREPFLPDPSYGPWFQLGRFQGIAVDEYWEAQTAPGSRPVLRNRSGAPLVVVKKAGKGRSAIVLSDRLWRNYYGMDPEKAIEVEILYRNLLRYLSGDPAFSDLHSEWERNIVLPGAKVRTRIFPERSENLLLVGEGGGIHPLPTPDPSGNLTFSAPITPDIYYLNIGGATAPEPLLVSIPLRERTHLQIPISAWKRWEKENHIRLIRSNTLPNRFRTEITRGTRKIISRTALSLADSPWFYALGFLVILLDLALRRFLGAR